MPHVITMVILKVSAVIPLVIGGILLCLGWVTAAVSDAEDRPLEDIGWLLFSTVLSFGGISCIFGSVELVQNSLLDFNRNLFLGMIALSALLTVLSSLSRALPKRKHQNSDQSRRER